jgi:hypothetical protein
MDSKLARSSEHGSIHINRDIFWAILTTVRRLRWLIGGGSSAIFSRNEQGEMNKGRALNEKLLKNFLTCFLFH